MKKMIALLALCLVSAAATAQGMPPQTANNDARMERAITQLQSRFANANVTHDGKLTRAQAEAGMPKVAQHFDEIDTQQNGYVTLTQIEDFMRQREAAH